MNGWRKRMQDEVRIARSKKHGRTVQPALAEAKTEMERPREEEQVMAKTIGPKNINQAREPRPDLGKSLNESTVEKVLSQPDQEQEPLSPVAGAYASADAAAENAEAEDAPAPTPTSEPPHGIDPLSGCSLASAYVNRYRFEGGEMTVKLIFGEGVASNTDTVVRSVLTMSLVDFQRFVHAANQIVAAYRVRPAGAP